MDTMKTEVRFKVMLWPVTATSSISCPNKTHDQWWSKLLRRRLELTMMYYYDVDVVHISDARAIISTIGLECCLLEEQIL
jgi:hypothetical protein